MHSDSFLFQAFIYLLAAVVSVPIAKRAGLGSVLGYLLAGLIIGPFFLGLVGSEENVMHFAEFGVVMMLFLIGLELRPALLWRLRKSIVGLGGLQVLITTILLTLIARLAGLPWESSIAIGMTLALSSTAIVLQTLNEKGIMKTGAGESSFSVLLFQDIAVIPMMALMPLLVVGVAVQQAPGVHEVEHQGIIKTLKVVAAVIIIVFGGRYLIRHIFREIAQTKLREIFTATALLLVIGIAVLMESVDLSPALGTFLAGVMLSDSEYRHELESNIEPFKDVPGSEFSTDEELTDYDDVTQYNNFYEFSTDKSGPAELSRDFKARPWTLVVEGECNKPKQWDIDELIGRFPLEERIYRHRCVEAWSMVVPWIGFELSKLIEYSEPTGNAKYIEFETLYDPKRMPGQRPGLFGNVLDWPYREGLRMDEAMNALTLLTVGLYGEILPNQNGAPVRLIIPWKYGFKGIKSIVTIRFVENQPLNTWQAQAPREYGFFANVNPDVDHPRWSQAKERRIGDLLKRPTLMFNGYTEQVAGMYSGMDLTKYF